MPQADRIRTAYYSEIKEVMSMNLYEIKSKMADPSIRDHTLISKVINDLLKLPVRSVYAGVGDNREYKSYNSFGDILYNDEYHDMGSMADLMRDICAYLSKNNHAEWDTDINVCTNQNDCTYFLFSWFLQMDSDIILT